MFSGKTKCPTRPNDRSTKERKSRVKKIHAQLDRIYPDARLDLDFTNPLELLVALILAAQARDDQVRQITPELFVKYRTAEDYVRTPLDELEKDIRRINFYRKKARAIHNCCRVLIERFGGKVPDDLEKLVALPGVGRKTANIVLGNVFDRHTIGVDTHVMRLSQRLGLSNETDPDLIEAELTKLVAKALRVRFCHLLQYHGRRICVARKPKCLECAIKNLCPYPARPDAGG